MAECPLTSPGYPLQFQLNGRLCIVVGGGRVGLRKASGLLRAGARVRLITAAVAADLSLRQEIEIIRRPYQEGDLAGAVLAFAATDDRQVNAAVAAEARRRHIPVNIADDPAASDFLLPATLLRGDLTIAVTTGGRSPALAAQVRDQLAELVGPEWEIVLEIAAALRRKRLTVPEKAGYNQGILRQLLEGGLPSLISGGDAKEIDDLLGRLLGKGFSLADLGIHLPKGMP
ncbi:precorrin-2 dehydrogenase/sirohydrochlorin ferrochelatase family protein [Trichloromonas sp.]|uniref:precorrin-2 dehydrogenase/sirohydrochlorin ferrochelatase family protein n=1 Tax=Trichloromonas sp. TaxID=3069249 RepID=UPI003D8172B1